MSNELGFAGARTGTFSLSPGTGWASYLPQDALAIAAGETAATLQFSGVPEWASANNVMRLFLLRDNGGNTFDIVGYGDISEPLTGEALNSVESWRSVALGVQPGAGVYRLGLLAVAGTWAVSVADYGSGARSRGPAFTTSGTWTRDGYNSETGRMLLAANVSPASGGSPAPSVSSVSSTSPAHGSTLRINISNGAATGKTATFGGLAQPVVSEAAGYLDVTFTPPAGIGFGDAGNLVVSSGGQQSAPVSLTVQPPTGWASWVQLTSLAPSGSRPVGSPQDLQVGGRIAWQSALVTFNADATASTDSAPQTTQAMYWDASTGYSNVFAITLQDAAVTAPVVSGQTAGAITSSTCQPAAQLSEGGTLHYALFPDGGAPADQGARVAAIKQGTGALASDQAAVSAGVLHPFPLVAGLSSATAYDLWFVGVGSGGDSADVRVDFSTASAGADTTPPVVSAPAPLTVTLGPGEISILASDPRIAPWLAAASATDAGGPAQPVVSHNCPSTLLLSMTPYTITWSATDNAGLVGTASAQLHLEGSAAVVPITGAARGIFRPVGSVWQCVGQENDPTDSKRLADGQI